MHYKLTSSTENLFEMENDELLDFPKLFKYRWFILALYSVTAFLNTLVWLSLFTITDATVAFYKINDYALLWSSNAFTLIQVIIAVPVSFIPSRLGLRTTMVLATCINAIGASVMIAATHREGFIFFVLGQTIIAVSAGILPQLASLVSATWFGANEYAISTSIGIIIGNSGAAIGFLQPALLMKNIDPKKNIEYVGKQLQSLIYSQAALCILILVLVLLFFKDKPKQPPTLAQAARLGESKITWTEFKNQSKILLKDKNYILCGNSYALSSVLLIIVPVILNNIMSWRFPHHDASIGWMGFGGIIAGIIGSVVFGYVLDKSKAFKVIALTLGTLSLLLWIGFTEILAQLHILSLTMVIFIVNLIFFIPFGPVLVDIMSEMTYPIPESLSYVLPITLGRFYSIPVMFLIGWLVEIKQHHITCLVVALILLVCLILVIFLKISRKRTLAENQDQVSDLIVDAGVSSSLNIHSDILSNNYK